MKISSSKSAYSIIIDILAVLAIAVFLIGVMGEAAYAKGKPDNAGQSQSAEKSNGSSDKGRDDEKDDDDNEVRKDSD